MRAYGLRSIEVQTLGNDITIDLKGEFIDTRYSLIRIETTRRNSGIELNIVTGFDEQQAITTETAPFKKTISVTNLNPGVYYIRVDNNNNWVKWFKIVSPSAQGLNQLSYR